MGALWAMMIGPLVILGAVALAGCWDARLTKPGQSAWSMPHGAHSARAGDRPEVLLSDDEIRRANVRAFAELEAGLETTPAEMARRRRTAAMLAALPVAMIVALLSRLAGDGLTLAALLGSVAAGALVIAASLLA